MRHVVAIRPKTPSSEKHVVDYWNGRRVYEGKHGWCGGRRVQRTITMAILSLLATAAVLLLSGRVSVGVPGLFTPTSYEVVSGFFAQSLNSTSDATFDFVRSHP